MGLLPTKVSSMSDFDRLYFELNQVRGHAKEGRWDERLSHGALRKLEEHLGYTFKQPYLALEAMTHPSFLASELPSYERLEILGDALLDYFVVQYIYRTYPGLDQGALTVLKVRSVVTSALARPS